MKNDLLKKAVLIEKSTNVFKYVVGFFNRRKMPDFKQGGGQPDLDFFKSLIL
jgi:hypothetical protein